MWLLSFVWSLRWSKWIHHRDFKFAAVLLLFAGVLLESYSLEKDGERWMSAWKLLRLLCGGAMVSITAYAWWFNLTRLRVLQQTPRSTVAGAAQGLVELVGEGASLHPEPDARGLRSPLRSEPCLWYRFEIRARDLDGDDWTVLESGESKAPFLLIDHSDQCVIFPAGAEIFTQHYADWKVDGRWFHEWTLRRGDALRVIGSFSSNNGSAAPLHSGFDAAPPPIGLEASGFNHSIRADSADSFFTIANLSRSRQISHIKLRVAAYWLLLLISLGVLGAILS